MAFHDPEERVGTVLGGTWTVERIIGEGAVAAVYAAHDGKDTRVALKILHPHTAKIDEVCRRFLREAKVANSIPHPGVVRVFEGGVTDDDCPWLAMELLEGETIEQRWERKGQRLPLPEVMWIADQILDVLAAAHKRGVVHRDIKPDNVFLTTDRKIKLLDFGIARLRDLKATQVLETQFGSVMGTPAFMSPEQARGDTTQVGIESDLWAVGATMYTLLSGQLVHDAVDIEGLILASGTEAAPSLAIVAPGLPEPVVGLVDFALAFDKAKRWPSARAMQNALRVAYRETAPRSKTGPIPEADITERPMRLSKPEAPPPSLRRPPREE